MPSLRAFLAPSMLLLGLQALADAAAGTPFGPPEGYKVVWADEFDVDGLPDPNRWDYDTERNKVGWHNNERQYYSGPRAANAVVRGGNLIITARLETMSSAADWGGQRYTSTRLLTRGKADWTYGYFEVRAKLPCGKGTWPAIWTLGSKGRWPDNGELDIMEHVGSNPERVTSAIHTSAGHGGHAVFAGARVPTACREFHRYQMHWSATEVVFGIDGFVHLRYPRLDVGQRAWPFDAPQYLLLNIAIGGDLGGEVDDGIFPVAMEVDYVRIYQAPKLLPREPS